MVADSTDNADTSNMVGVPDQTQGTRTDTRQERESITEEDSLPMLHNAMNRENSLPQYFYPQTSSSSGTWGYNAQKKIMSFPKVLYEGQSGRKWEKFEKQARKCLAESTLPGSSQEEQGLAEVKLASTFLEGGAKLWFANELARLRESGKGPKDGTGSIRLLKSEFGPPVPPCILDAVRAMTKRKSKNPLHMARTMRAMAEKMTREDSFAPMSIAMEKAAARALMKSLPKKYKSEWPSYGHYPEDLDGCVALLKKVEEHQRPESDDYSESSDSSSSGSSSDSEAEMKKKRRRKKREKESAKRKSNVANQALLASVDALTNMVKQLAMTRPIAAIKDEFEICAVTGERRPVGQCWECGGYGHRRMDCPKMLPCSLCHKKGHDAATCNVPVCQRCNPIQHFPAECPRKGDPMPGAATGGHLNA